MRVNIIATIVMFGLTRQVFGESDSFHHKSTPLPRPHANIETAVGLPTLVLFPKSSRETAVYHLLDAICQLEDPNYYSQESLLNLDLCYANNNGVLGISLVLLRTKAHL